WPRTVIAVRLDSSGRHNANFVHAAALASASCSQSASRARRMWRKLRSTTLGVSAGVFCFVARARATEWAEQALAGLDQEHGQPDAERREAVPPARADALD